MRKILTALAISATVALPGAAMAQWHSQYDWGAYSAGHHQRDHRAGNDRGMCREMRAACMHKGELGERGEGNCRRYRQMCRN